jgi:hypothetical protein
MFNFKWTIKPMAMTTVNTKYHKHYLRHTLRSEHVRIKFKTRSQYCEKRLFASSCLSVCSHGTTWLPHDGSSWNVISELLFGIPQRKFKSHQNLIRTCILHKHLLTFLVQFLLEWKNVSAKRCRQVQFTHIIWYLFDRASLKQII